MNIALVDLPDQRSKLFPLTMTRPAGALRVGILTLQDKWVHYLDQKPDLLSVELLNAKFQKSNDPYELIINGTICPDKEICKAIQSLDEGQVLLSSKGFIAAKGNFTSLRDLADLEIFERKEYLEDFVSIERTWDIFLLNSDQIRADFALLTEGKKSEDITDPHTVVYGRDHIFLEEGVKLRAAYLNAEAGPIYLAKGCEIQEGAAIRGPFFLGENSRVNLNAQLREGTSIGPGCKVGGEISNSIIYANSNKAHGGFLGNSIIGEFCNLGAATNNSNLKNNYDHVKMWDYQVGGLIDTGLQFCGMVMGDHSKSAIGTTFNTGTTIGVSSNIFGSGFPPKFIRSFAWGGADKMVTYSLERALQTANLAISRKIGDMSTMDLDILKAVYEESVNVGV